MAKIKKNPKPKMTHDAVWGITEQMLFNEHTKQAGVSSTPADVKEEVHADRLHHWGVDQLHRQSLEFAAHIQAGRMISEEWIEDRFSEALLINRPKDIVSGDTVWVKELDDTVLMAVIDCTGHGVLGAMLTMLCHSKLDIAVEVFRLFKPEAILNKVNQMVSSFFQGSEQGDLGMDISLVSIDRFSGEVSYCGANRPLYLLRRTGNMMNLPTENAILRIVDAEHTLVELKGNAMAVGNAPEGTSFRSTRFRLTERDALYMCSDGYADQFGGQSGKKFLAKNLRNMLHQVGHLPMNVQKSVLQHTLDAWKVGHEQTDDILLLGLRWE